MPRRAQDYMDSARAHIAESALHCFIENGLFETSVRDVCIRADVSMGALYSHFKDKNALLEDTFPRLITEDNFAPIASSWQEFEEIYVQSLGQLIAQDNLNRLALSYEIAALSARGTVKFETLHAAQIALEARMNEMLETFFNNGEIGLPLGSKPTARALSAWLVGCAYQIGTGASRIDIKGYIDEALRTARYLVSAERT